MLSLNNKLKLLGVVAGIPLSVDVLGRQVMLLYVLLFIPLALSIVFYRPINNRKWSIIDKIGAGYLLWALLGFLIYIILSVWIDVGQTGARIGSAIGTMAYATLPFLLGRFLCQSDDEIQSILEGLIAGVILSCGALLAAYAVQWPIDIFSARYEIGQRIPMVVGFIAILNLSRNQPLTKLFLITFIAVSLVVLSETRVSIAAFMISLLMVLLVFRKIYGRGKIRVVVIALLMVGALAAQLTASLQHRMNLLASTVNNYVSAEQKSTEQKSTEQKSTEQKSTEQKSTEHLADASADMRLQIWRNLFSKLTDSPMHFILGYGQLGPSFVGDPLRYENGYVVQMYSAHNDYLDAFVRTGFIGLIIYLALLCSVIVASWKSRGTAPGSVGFMFFHVTIALIGVALYGMLHETTRYPWFGVIFWLLAGILSSRMRNNGLKWVANDQMQVKNAPSN